MQSDCLTFQSQARQSISQGWTCSKNATCWHTQIEVVDGTAVSPSHSILTLDLAVPVLTLQHQVSGRASTSTPMTKSFVTVDNSQWYPISFSPGMCLTTQPSRYFEHNRHIAEDHSKHSLQYFWHTSNYLNSGSFKCLPAVCCLLLCWLLNK